ncbi:MAG TPA: hypothetical protein VHS05_08875 [Pyrinomonadaceae bacterium]|jgi:hypothetical protein|nr:hypothetical protein [Pyrinomonadaceae bacterium]
MVRLLLALLSGFATIGAFSSIAEDVLPPRFNFDRYTAMAHRSPFAVATAVALPEATPGFAKDLYVGNAARFPEGDMVTIKSSSDQNFKKYLTTKQPVDGYGVAQIEWSEDVGKTTVTISKDGQFATLAFNQSLLAQAASAGRPRDRMPQMEAITPSAGANQASRSDALDDIVRNPKIVSAPPAKAAAASRFVSDDLAPAPAARVPPRAVAPPEPLGPSQQLSDK